MAKLGGQHDCDLAIGIGINTGEVIMRAMGSRERMLHTVLGDHVNLPARLCAQAGPNQTLISESSYRPIAGSSEFAIVALAPIALRGKSAPVPVYEVGMPAEQTAPAARSATAGT